MQKLTWIPALAFAAVCLTGFACSSSEMAEQQGPTEGTNEGAQAGSELEQLGCSTASPPLAARAPSTVELAGPAPEPQGGEILEGLYFKTEVRFYDGLSAQPVPSSTIQVQAGTFIQRIGEADAPIGGRLGESIAAGTMTANGSAASFETSTCINGSSSGSRVNTVGYDASATRLLIHRAGVVEVFDTDPGE